MVQFRAEKNLLSIWVNFGMHAHIEWHHTDIFFHGLVFQINNIVAARSQLVISTCLGINGGP